MSVETWVAVGFYFLPGLAVALWLAIALTEPDESAPSMQDAWAVLGGFVGWWLFLLAVFVGLFLHALHERRRAGLYGARRPT